MNFPAASGFLTSTALVTGVALVAFDGATTMGFLTCFTVAAAVVGSRVVVVVVITGVVVGFGWE